jgi:preprotein translocase subunit SecD
MLEFSRVTAAAILLTVLVVCGFAVPNFLPNEMVKSWPSWAQRRLVLGPDLQGGSTLQLELDRNDVREQLLKSLRRDARDVLHEERINLVRPVALRGDSVEVRLLEANFEAGLAALRELAQPYNGIRWVEVVVAGDGLIRLRPTESALGEHMRLTVDQSVPIIERRINELGLVEPTVQRVGTDRILVQVPGLSDPRHMMMF